MPTIRDPARVLAIEVIEIAAGQARGWAGRTAVPGVVVASWAGEQVDAVLSLVTALPQAEQMRCFTPGYALRMRDGEGVLAELAFCFRCRNGATVAFEPGFVTPEWFTFDPDSPPALRLLSMFRVAAGTEDSGPRR